MAEKADSELVRRQNRRLVLEALRQKGPLARIELGRSTGLSPASITAISSQLIDERAIEEVAVPLGVSRARKRGRPMVQLSLTSSAALVVAVKISIDHVGLVLADFQGRIRAERDIRILTSSAQEQSFASRGRLDIVVVNKWVNVELFRNVTEDAGHWVQVKLRQTGANPDAIGAKIEIKRGDQTEHREVFSGGGHVSGMSGFWHWGLGKDQYARLRVIWPDGVASTWVNVAADRFYEIDRDKGVRALF